MKEEAKASNESLIKARKAKEPPAGRTTYPWAELKPGYELVATGRVAYMKLRGAATQRARLKGWKIKCRWDLKTDEGRVYRVS